MKELNQTREKIKLLFEAGRAAKTREEFLEKMNPALKMAQSIKDYSLQVEIQTSLACGEILDGNWQKFRSNASVVMNLLKDLEDPVLEVAVLYSFGESIGKVGDFANSNIWYEKALVIARKSNQFKPIADLLAMLGIQTSQIPTETRLERLHNFGESLDYFREGLEVVIEHNLPLRTKAMMIQNSGMIHMNMGNKDLALNDYNLALEIAEEIEDNSLKQEIVYNLRLIT